MNKLRLTCLRLAKEETLGCDGFGHVVLLASFGTDPACMNTRMGVYVGEGDSLPEELIHNIQTGWHALLCF